jgi:hypothetical protein
MFNPLLRLSGTDKGQHSLGKDCPLLVKAVSVHGHVAVGQQMRFDDGFEGGFAMTLDHALAPSARASEFRAHALSATSGTKVVVSNVRQTASTPADLLE